MSPILLIFTNGLGLLRRSPSERVVPALLVTVAFGAAALLLRGVTITGALAGTVSAFLIYLGLGLGGFVTLVAVFVLTLFTTRLGYRRKQQLGLAEPSGGRNAGQVLANLAVAAVFAVLATRNAWLAVAAVAAMAEAAADTSQSEIGEIASRRAWSITSFREVPPGTDGGITLPGLLAGLVAAAIVALVARVTHVLGPNRAAIAGFVGFLGTIIDSLLGATLERAGWLNNDAVNFLSTLSAAAIALAFVRQ